MKIIVQSSPDEFEQTLSNISEMQMYQFKVDKETYGYFLNEIFEKQFEAFVERKTKKNRHDILGFNPDSTDGAKKI